MQPDHPLLKARVDEHRNERDHNRTASEVFARAMHVLTVENDNFRKDLDKSKTSNVTPLRPC